MSIWSLMATATTTVSPVRDAAPIDAEALAAPDAAASTADAVAGAASLGVIWLTESRTGLLDGTAQAACEACAIRFGVDVIFNLPNVQPPPTSRAANASPA